MGTTAYFEEAVSDAATDQTRQVECGTTGLAGDGPQMYLKVDGRDVLFSHDTARKYCASVANVARHLGYTA